MQTMTQFLNQYMPRAMHFAVLSSLIYTIPVLYAIAMNMSLLADYTALLLLFFTGHFVLYLAWYAASPKAGLAEDRMQLFMYQATVLAIVFCIALMTGLMHPNTPTAAGFFFGYIALPTLYGVLAVINYTLFVRVLKIW